jgi:hypothetical protein
LERPFEVWFQDKARVGKQGTVTRIWARCGSRPRAKKDRRFTKAYLFGAACPERGVGAAIVMPEVNIAAMNAHLAVISRAVSVGTIAVMVLDGASWHASPRLRLPDNIVLLPLPPYAPELNPIEPRTSSLLSTEYRLAVSKKLIPASSAFLMNGRLSSSPSDHWWKPLLPPP